MAEQNRVNIAQLLAAAKENTIAKDALREKLQAIVTAQNFDYDIAELAGLRGLADMLPEGDNLRAALIQKIGERFAQLEGNEHPDSKQPQDEHPDSEQPQDAAPEFSKTEYDGLPSYDLRKKFEKAVENHDEKEQKKILSYVQGALQSQELSPNNAPLFYDYTQILQQSGVEFTEEQLSALEEALQKYDEKNGLTNLTVTAEEYEENTAAWADFISKHDILKNQLPNFVAADLDEQAKKEAYDLLRSMALSELALEKPAEDEKENEVRLAKKLQDILILYKATFEATVKKMEDEAQKELTKAYCQYLQVSPKDYIAIYQKADDATKKRMEAEFRHFKLQYIADSFHAGLNVCHAVKASRIAQKTTAKSTPDHVRVTLNNFMKAHPKIISVAKNVLINGGTAFVFGPVGMTALTTYKFGAALLDSYRRYKGTQEQAAERKGFWNKLKGSGKDLIDMSKNFKAFVGYLKNNPDEKLALAKAGIGAVISTAFAGYGIASGAVSYGLAGNLMGMAGDVAQQAALAGGRRVVSLGATSAFAGVTSVLKNKQIAPKKAEMMEILNKYVETTAPQGQNFKSFLKNIFYKKSPAEKLYDNLTATLQKGNDAKLQAKLDAAIANITPEDKARLVALAKDVISLKQTKAAAIGSAIAGAVALEVTDTLHGHGHIINTDNANQTSDIEASSGTTHEDGSTPSAEQGNDNSTQPSAKPSNPIENQGDAVTTHTFTAEDTKNYDFAINATPTPTYQKLMEMGVLSKEEANKMMGGRSYIPSRVLKDFIENKAQFTAEQTKEFNDFVNDHEARLKEFLADRASREQSTNIADSSVNHDVVSPEETEQKDLALAKTDIKQTPMPETEVTSDDLALAKTDVKQTPMPEAEQAPQSQAYKHTISGSAHRALFGYQDKQTTVEISDDKDYTSQSTFAKAAQKMQEQIKGKSRFSLSDNQGNSATVHVQSDKITVDAHYKDQTDVDFKQKTQIYTGTGTEVSTFGGKGRAVEPDFVGSEEGGDDYVTKALNHAKGRMMVVKDGGYVAQDGSNAYNEYESGGTAKTDHYIVQIDDKGNETVSEGMTAKQANKIFNAAVKDAKGAKR